MRDSQVRAVVRRDALPGAALAHPLFWYVGFHDGAEQEIYRQDAHGEELNRLIARNANESVVVRRFRSVRQPATWTVWPYDYSSGWLHKLTLPLDTESVTVGVTASTN